MIEVQERRSSTGVKEAVRLRRFIKELSHEEDIALVGVKGQRLEGILDKTDEILSQLQEEHKDWIEQKRQLFADYLSPVKPAVAEEAYKGGLATTITQEFRTYGKVSKEETIKLDDPEYLRKVITGYTVDFLRSLRISERLGINPNIALDVARLSYHYNPTKLSQLTRQYPDINISALERAALGYPKNPEGFLDSFIVAIDRLTKDPRYKDLNPGALERAALSYPKNPEGFLDSFIEKVKLGKLPSEILQEEALRGFMPAEMIVTEETLLPPQFKDE